MPVSLDQIVQSTRMKVSEAKRAADTRELERRAELHVPRGFRRGIEEKSKTGVAVIAELKKASPSKGLIREEFRVAELAGQLEAGGAAALSVLTDEEFAFHLGRRAAVLVREQFGWPAVAEKFAEICQRAAKGHTLQVESQIMAKSNEPKVV